MRGEKTMINCKINSAEEMVESLEISGELNIILNEIEVVQHAVIKSMLASGVDEDKVVVIFGKIFAKAMAKAVKDEK